MKDILIIGLSIWGITATAVAIAQVRLRRLAEKDVAWEAERRADNHKAYVEEAERHRQLRAKLVKILDKR